MNWRRYLGQALDVAPALALLTVLVMAFVWPSAAFADGAAVKCAPNEERAWLYDSVTSFNVEAKLKCGENVEVIGQENGYVKVRTANGTEGYLPASNLPKIPAAPDMPGTDAKPAEPQSLASLARAAAARRATAAPAPAASAAPVAAPNAVPSSAVASVAAAPVAAAPVAAAPVAVAKMVAPASPTPAAPSAAPAPQPKTVAAAPVPAQPATLTVSSTTASPAAAIPATANPAAAASHAKAKAASKPATPTTTVTTSAKTPPVNAPATANPPAPRPATTAPLHVASATPAPKAPSAQPATAVADIYVGGGTNSPTTVPKGAPKAASNAPMVRTVSQTSEDDDDSYLTRPKNESEDPSCQTYFSGYGLSPGQFKWLVENRVKKYPSICPAASPAMVDYVIIFTHDVDFFNYTMPAPVHYEAGGFSDWTPILQYDMSVVSHSDVDKSKREYVWVFHVKRGAYDPNKFSPHRRFQYTKIEGKYSKTVEDAFEFIGSQGAER